MFIYKIACREKKKYFRLLMTQIVFLSRGLSWNRSDQAYIRCIDILIINRGHRCRDRMKVWFTTTYAISANHDWCSNPAHGEVHTIQYCVIKLVSDLRQVSFTNKTDRYDIADILLKVAFETTILHPQPYVLTIAQSQVIHKKEIQFHRWCCQWFIFHLISISWQNIFLLKNNIKS